MDPLDTLTPQDRTDLLGEVHRGIAQGGLKDQAAIDAYIAQRTGGQHTSMRDLMAAIPATSDRTTMPNGPTTEEQVAAIPSALWNTIKGAAQVGMTGGTPGGIATMGPEGQQFVQGIANLGTATGRAVTSPVQDARLAKALGTQFLGDLGIRGGNVNPLSPEMEQARKDALAAGSAALIPLTMGAASSYALPSALAGGAAASPEAPITGAGAAGLGLELAKVGGGLVGAASRLRALPDAMALKALANTTVPASGGIGGITKSLATYAPEMGNVAPKLYEASAAGQRAMQEAASKSPEVYAWLKQQLESRGTTPKGKPIGIAEAIKAQRNTELGPQFDAFKAEPTPFQMGEKSYTVGEANTNPAAAQALKEAVRNGWKPPTPQQIASKPTYANEAIPGSGGGNWLMSDPNILDAAKQLPKGGVPPGTENPNLAAGETPTQGQAFAIKKILDRKIDAAKGLETQQALIASRDRLYAELRAQNPALDALASEWARRSQLADQYKQEVGTFALPSPPTAFGGHTPLGISAQSLVTRPAVWDVLEQYRRAKALSAGAMLGAEPSGTPLTIQDVLDALGPLRKKTPSASPPAIALKNRSGVLDLTSMTPEQRFAYIAMKGAQNTDRAGVTLTPEQMLANYLKEIARARPSQVQPGPVKGLIP